MATDTSRHGDDTRHGDTATGDTVSASPRPRVPVSPQPEPTADLAQRVTCELLAQMSAQLDRQMTVLLSLSAELARVQRLLAGLRRPAGPRPLGLTGDN